MSGANMTDGDRRAEADRIAKARGPAYAEGYQAGLMRAIAILQSMQVDFTSPEYVGVGIRDEALDDAIDAIGQEVTS